MQSQQPSPAKRSALLSAPTTGLYFFTAQKTHSDPSISLAKNYTAATLPFFCSMESQVHRRINLWIKLRAGSDESYMNMISPAVAH